MRFRFSAVLVVAVVFICSWARASAQSYPQTLRVVQSQQDGRFSGCLSAESGVQPVGLAEYCLENSFMFQNHRLNFGFPVARWQLPVVGRCVVSAKFGLEITDPQHRYVHLVDPMSRAYYAATETQAVAMVGCDGRFGDPRRLSWADNWGKVMIGVGTVVSGGPIDGSAERGNVRDFSLDNIRLEAYQKLTAPKAWSVSVRGQPRLELDAFVLVPVRDGEHDARFPGFDDSGMTIYRVGAALTKPIWLMRSLALEPAVRGEMFWQNRGHQVEQLAVLAGINWGDEGNVGVNARIGYAWRSLGEDLDGRVIRFSPASQVGQRAHDPRNWFAEVFVSLRRPGAVTNVANN